MFARRPLWILAVAALGLAAFGTSEALAGGATAPAQDEPDPDLVATGAQVYAAKCNTCHQPGGVGVPGSFPPLAGNPNAEDPEYVALTVTEGLSGPIEVLGATYDAVMDPLDLSGDELDAVVAYVGTLAAQDLTPTPTTTAAAGPADAGVGKKLFIGATGFENGGAACSSCHTAGSVGNLGGWSLGPDLTDTIERFGGEGGLSAWLGNPPAPTMTPLFADHPLTGDEIADLVAFLSDAPDQSEPEYFGDALLWAALAGLVVLLGGMAIAWRGMRQTYVEKLRGARS